MTNKIVPIDSAADAPTALRNIADAIERGEYHNEGTLVFGNDVFLVGIPSHHLERAAEKAVFDLNYGIHKMMNRALQAESEE